MSGVTGVGASEGRVGADSGASGDDGWGMAMVGAMKEEWADGVGGKGPKTHQKTHKNRDSAGR